MRFRVSGVRAGAREPITQVLEAATPEEAASVATARGIDVRRVTALGETPSAEAAIPIAVAVASPPPSSRPPRLPADDAAIIDRAVWYTFGVAGILFIGGVLAIYYGIEPVRRRMTTPELWIRGVYIATPFLLLVLVCVTFASNMSIGRMWGAAGSMMIATITSGALFLAVVFLGGRSLPMGIAVALPLIVAVAAVVYSIRAIIVIART
jgi:hypothetical protein